MEIKLNKQIEYDPLMHRVRIKNKIIDLTLMENRILLMMVQNKNSIVYKTEFIDNVLLHSTKVYINPYRTIDMHIVRLRKKLEEIPERPQLIQTVWGVGYKLVL